MSCSTKPWNSETVTQTAYFMEEKTYLEFGCGDSCAESEEGLEGGREGGREGEAKGAVKDTMGKVISFRKNVSGSSP